MELETIILKNPDTERSTKHFFHLWVFASSNMNIPFGKPIGNRKLVREHRQTPREGK